VECKETRRWVALRRTRHVTVATVILTTPNFMQKPSLFHGVLGGLCLHRSRLVSVSRIHPDVRDTPSRGPLGVPLVAVLEVVNLP
jgi:hypothetical protein